MAFLLSAILPASAAAGIANDGIAQGGYVDPVAGANPHGGYSATSNKCKVCHAVHGASAGGQALMRTENTYTGNISAVGGGCSCHNPHPGVLPPSPPWPNPSPWPDPNAIVEDNVSSPCVYCHVSGSFAITKVYDGNPDNYWMESIKHDYANNHASSHAFGYTRGGVTTYYQGCPSCHSVHGANTWTNSGEGVTAAKILRNRPGRSLSAPVTNMTDFCRDCHDMTGLNGANLPTQNLGTCALNHCHHTESYDPAANHSVFRIPTTWVEAVGRVTNSPTRDGPSHIMTTTLTNAQGQERARVGSPSCRSCHSGGDHTPGNSWPHMTSGAAFLADYHTVPTQLDRVCLDCHDDGVQDGGFGVGDSF